MGNARAEPGIRIEMLSLRFQALSQAVTAPAA
jgi:hypothetical protein